MWLLALLVACGCTEMGCLTTLSLRIEGVADAETVEVIVTGVPGGERCTWDASGVGACDGQEEPFGGVEMQDDVLVMDTVGAFHDAPTPITVTVIVDGEVALETTAEPEWSPFYPNGKRCGGACHGAEVELAVP